MHNNFTLKGTIEISFTDEEWKEILMRSEGFSPNEITKWDRYTLDIIIDKALLFGNLTKYIKSIYPEYQNYIITRGE